MTRADFTNKLTHLFSEMINNGDQPVLDHAMRSKQEQRRLYDLGLSKCDGEKRISRHQLGLAVDIYFMIDGKIVFDYNQSPKALELSKKYHEYWEKTLGGRAVIEWDLPHYEF